MAITYAQDLKDEAKKDKSKKLITIDVGGSINYQGVAEPKEWQSLLSYLNDFFKRMSEPGTPEPK